ncbi:DNA (cytosine-5)-methyltransferase 1 [Clostridium acidisoli DSM 12555]|uniref:DNA (cytosine-5-)-methyltransferase n=1 Tax=Clostridium acidisoli DSM 12555 TaxID=1121291 RepID=A0A1W1X0N4_9CLOT|nr:DNA (cytosine-5)-methyltransferase 1 [Clostridium acidisoli DSM 12555]
MSKTFLDFFAGIGGFRRGMEMAGHKCLGHCEWDKYANRSYKVIHELKEDEWFGEDIRKVRADELPKSDVWCFGFPCQDISVAGKQLGFNGKRSSLFFTVTKLIADLEEEDRPSTLFIENVKNLLSVNGGIDFLKLLIELDEIGYDAEWQVLNTKYFGLPQNRERVFIIGHIRGRSRREVFPIGGINNKTNLKQLIPGSDAQRVYDSNGIAMTLKAEGGGQGAKTGLNAVNVSRKSNAKYTDVANCLMARDYKGIGNQEMTAVAVLAPNRIEKRQNGRRIKEPGESMFTLTAQDRHGVLIKEATKQGYAEAHEGDSINLEQPNSSTRRGRVGKEAANTLTTSCNQGTLIGRRIRKLTPKECFRLQGWNDEDFEKAASVCSDSQLYKQAGNGVTVNVIYEIAKRL